MFSLFLDTHSDNVLVVLYKDGKTFDFISKSSERDHCTVTMSLIDELLRKNNLNVHNLSEIIVVNGPGSFTGVRIGVTIAKTLALVLKLPIKTITCLEIYGLSNNKGCGKIIAVKDTKGYYFTMFNQKNENMWDYSYLPEKDFDNLIKFKNLSRMVIKENFKYDIDEIYDYIRLKPVLNPHEVNPIYIKSVVIE